MISLNEFVNKYKNEYSVDYLEAVYRVLKLEGGLVDNSNDAGGKTKYGISSRFIEQNYNAIVSLKIAPDVSGLTMKNAVDIYYYLFWEKIRAGEIKSKFVRYYLFDCSVNMGKVSAVKLLQKSVCDVISVDGIIGRQTIGAVNRDLGCVELNFIKNRTLRYGEIAKRARNIMFLEGWLNRCFAYNDLLNCESKGVSNPF